LSVEQLLNGFVSRYAWGDGHAPAAIRAGLAPREERLDCDATRAGAGHGLNRLFGCL
jgi:hypothetical protein